MMAVVTGESAAELLAAGAALHADAVAAEAVAALSAIGIASILLRGRVIAHHLYDSGEIRSYADADLLIQVRNRERAEGTLRNLGYAHVAVLGQGAEDRPRWSSTWTRDGDGAEVDLHWTLVGVGATTDEAWTVLAAEAQPLERHGVRGLNKSATALVVALHAAHHGVAVHRPLEDLRRAVERFPSDVWIRARELAVELDAVDAMSAGLRLVQGGVGLADALGLPRVRHVETILRAESAPPTALGFEWLSRTPGLRRKTLLVAGKLFPGREFMRAWFAPARRSRSALILAYAWRPLWLSWHSITGARAWLRARAKAKSRE
jgi:hypothetical protein